MSEHREKRDDLERFVKEQIIGPGAYNKRFFFLKELQLSPDSKIADMPALENMSEIIPELPAYQYSSAILFPRTSIGNNAQDVEPVAETEENLDMPAEDTSADDDNIVENKDDILINQQQNYPNQVGISFVVDHQTELSKDLTFSFKFRKYKQVSKKKCIEKGISIWVTENNNELKEIIEKYFDRLFYYEEVYGNGFIGLRSLPINDDLYDIDYLFLNEYLRTEVINIISNTIGERLELLEQKNDTAYFGYKEQTANKVLYSISDKVYNNRNYEKVVTLYTSNLKMYVEEQLRSSITAYGHLAQLIKTFELFMQLKKIVTDLKSIFKKNNATPIWQSFEYNIERELPEYNKGSLIDRKAALPISDDEECKGLDLVVQYLRKNNLVYVKLICINNSIIKLDPDGSFQLNKKDEANQKALFGVEIMIKENKEHILKQYNPPQLLEFDEEDSLNKLIYRNMIDLGEGYNTSVNWGRSDGKQYIISDFLPQHETPKVDFKPSKFIDGMTVSRLSQEKVLSIRYLSTLSSVADDDIIHELRAFIADYKVWIDERYVELNGLNLNNDILYRQLAACENDQKRLLRNVELLRDRKAMAAFRLMNTAMFMQLHHNWGIKEAKMINRSEYFHNFLNNEEYYKQTECIHFKDYSWRSFQLAFIILNIDASVRPSAGDNTVTDVFGHGWPERNEIADLIWFPTGGGKTEAYLGIIAFVIAHRRFTNAEHGGGTTVLMRYTLRLLTLQQFQRATLLICALETIRKKNFTLPNNLSLGIERITIGLFVGGDSLPNKWTGQNNSMLTELQSIRNAIQHGQPLKTNLPFTECPWCGKEIFINRELRNVYPNPQAPNYGINSELSICCNNPDCAFHSENPIPNESLPMRLFDEDIYKYPPTLLFGTVDKFAALANKVSTAAGSRNEDSRRFFGKGYGPQNCLPPELIIQDELHLLLGPLGTAVGLYERSIDHLCSYFIGDQIIRPKIITSTATTRNTDKQIFALFNRRSEIFPKQGTTCDDSFFSYYQRKSEKEYISNRKYIGILPIGKTQVWMQLRMASICFAHRLKFLLQNKNLSQLFSGDHIEELFEVMDNYHTILMYFNSLKDVGKTQSQLSHYLPGDLNYIIQNTLPWSFMDLLLREEDEIRSSELTGRLTGEEVKTNLSRISTKWDLFDTKDDEVVLNVLNPPEFVSATNMISVGIDISRFNTMIISSMPRNIAEYIQASSRVAREKEGIVFTVHHPYRSRDISHFQKFKEFHEKFYGYVEPISVTPFALKALDRYLAMFASVMIRHNDEWQLRNNEEVTNRVFDKTDDIIEKLMDELRTVKENAEKLDDYLRNRQLGIRSNVTGIISDDELIEIETKLRQLMTSWLTRIQESSTSEPPVDLRFRIEGNPRGSLFISITDEGYPNHWKVSHSLREIAPSTVIKTVQQ